MAERLRQRRIQHAEARAELRKPTAREKLAAEANDPDKVRASVEDTPGDWIAYYSPRTKMRGGDPVQAFTAIGRIRPGEPYAGDMGGGFHPIRRDVAFLKCREAPIRPLLDRLDFTRGHPSWGMVFRRGSFAVSREDFLTIAVAMGVPEAVEQAGS